MRPSPTPGQALKESRLPLPLLRRGKVREVYEVDAGHVLLVASDRVSAFDVVMREPIPRKGAVLTQISAFWFERLAAVFPSHYVTARSADVLARVPSLADYGAEIAGRAMWVDATEIEAVSHEHRPALLTRVIADALSSLKRVRDWEQR